MVRAQINSQKHIVQQSLSTVAAGAVATVIPVVGVLVNAASGEDDVRAGAQVKAIFLEQWMISDDATAPATYVFIVERAAGTVDLPTATDMANLHDYHNKNNVLYTSQGLLNAEPSVATPIVRQWIKIPKGKQRIALDDQIRIHFFSQTLATLRCGLAIYKEYF